jgi:hypothetical protein
VKVLALTRNKDGQRAHDLAEHGAEVVEADIGEKNSIEPLVEQTDGVFLMTNFWEHGFDAEVEQGRNVVELADEIGTDHLVFSSVGGADRETGIPHFDSKWVIERLTDDGGLSATVVRPVFFAQNLEGFRDSIEDGTLAMGLEPHVPLQVLDIEDLGAFVAEVFADPDRYVGEANRHRPQGRSSLASSNASPTRSVPTSGPGTSRSTTCRPITTSTSTGLRSTSSGRGEALANGYRSRSSDRSSSTRRVRYRSRRPPSRKHLPGVRLHPPPLELRGECYRLSACR